MISAMPAVAVRRGRKKSKTFGRFNQPPSHHSSTVSLAARSLAARLRSQRHSNVSTIRQRSRRNLDSELERQRRRFLIYTGTVFLISGLLLVFIGVGAAVPTAQNVGLLLIAAGAFLCIVKVFCSEAHATEVPTKIIVTEATPETPEAPAGEFTELAVVREATSPPPTAAVEEEETPPKAQTCAPPNSVPETQVLIENDSGARY